MTTQTDVNDLLRQVLWEGETIQARWQELAGDEYRGYESPIFKEAHQYLDSLEQDCAYCGHAPHPPGCEAGANPYGATDHVDCGCQGEDEVARLNSRSYEANRRLDSLEARIGTLESELRLHRNVGNAELQDSVERIEKVLRGMIEIEKRRWRDERSYVAYQALLHDLAPPSTQEEDDA